MTIQNLTYEELSNVAAGEFVTTFPNNTGDKLYHDTTNDTIYFNVIDGTPEINMVRVTNANLNPLPNTSSLSYSQENQTEIERAVDDDTVFIQYSPFTGDELDVIIYYNDAAVPVENRLEIRRSGVIVNPNVPTELEINSLQALIEPTLPANTEASTIYFTLDPSDTDKLLLHVTPTDPEVTPIQTVASVAKVDNKIATAIANFSYVKTVTDITARDTLITNATGNIIVLVLDASADSTVDAGAAAYIHVKDTNSTTKVYEAEGVDEILNYANILNGPSSSSSDLDDLVDEQHIHLNTAVLDLIEEVNGRLQYNGHTVGYLDAGTREW